MIRKEFFAKVEFAKNSIAKIFIVSYVPPDFLTAKQGLFMECVVAAPASGDNLFGRENELHHIWERLKSGDHMLMTGLRRVGKTSLMMELERQPRPGWTAVYVDVQACTDAQACIAKIFDGFSQVPELRTQLWASQAKETAHTFLEDVNLINLIRAVKVGAEPKGRTTHNWITYGNRVLKRMQDMQITDNRLLIIIDELPIAITRMAKSAGGIDEVSLFLSWYRQLRQNLQLQRKVSTLVGGSIRLEGLAHRLKVSEQISDLRSFPLGSWSKATAMEFLKLLGNSENFVIQERYIEEMLRMLEDFVPYHVQLFFLELRNTCGAKSAKISYETIQKSYETRLVGVHRSAHLNHLVEKIHDVFEQHEISHVLKILGALSTEQKGAEMERLAADVGSSCSEVEEIVDELVNEGYLVRVHSKVRFRSNLVRDWWQKYQKGRRR